MFAIYNKVSRECLIMIFFMCMFFLLSFFFCFFFLLSSYYLFKPSNYIITVIITIIFITITDAGILEKSSGGEFQARNSSVMVYPYSSH